MTNIYDPNYKSEIVFFQGGGKVVVFNDKAEILFLRRSEKTQRAGGWDFPGGALEAEDPIEGVRREAREEAGIEIKDVRPVSVFTQEREEPNKRNLIIGYVAKLKSGEVELSWEHDEYKWLSIEDSKKVVLPEMHKRFLNAAIEWRIIAG